MQRFYQTRNCIRCAAANPTHGTGHVHVGVQTVVAQLCRDCCRAVGGAVASDEGQRLAADRLAHTIDCDKPAGCFGEWLPTDGLDFWEA